MNNDFMGYSLFRDVTPAAVAAFNRTITARNIMEDHGKVMSTKYMETFNEAERLSIGLMSVAISQMGEDKVRIGLREECGYEQ